MKGKSVLALAMLCMMSFAVPVMAATTQDRQENSVPELTQPVEVAERYMLGDVLKLTDSQMVVDGTSYSAKYILHYPSGLAYAGTEAVLNETGKYSLEYKSIVDGVVKTVEKDFIVVDELYSVIGKVSSAYYGKHPKYAQDKTGIVASIANGEKLEYNRTIDLTGKTSKDSIVKIAVTPETPGVSDAEHIVFKFTDLYDPDNYVTVTAKKVQAAQAGASWAETASYVTANGAGQLPIGLEATSSGETVWEGGTYKLHRNNAYGASVKFSIPGTPNHPTIAEADVGSEILSVSFDYDQRRVYVNNTIVVDLDDPTFYGSVRWNGFTTGECTMSISGANYNASTMNLIITEVDGVTDFEENVLLDTEAPEITLETENVPDAVVGKPFAIPKATGYDKVDKEVAVSCLVYKSYNTPSQSRLQVSDNKFTPSAAGEYLIIYTASDKYGNTTQTTYTVNAVRKETELTIALGDKGSVQAAVGTVVTVADYELSNASGSTNVEITAVSGEHEYKVENLQFRPMYAGTYTIEYKYSDYIDTKTETYEIEVTKDGVPVIEAEASLPKYLIKGALYQTPSLSGFNFVNGEPQETQADLYISDDGGARRQHTAEKFVSYADEYCELVFVIGDTEKSYRIPVIDVGYGGRLDISKYFLGDFTAERGNSSITFESTSDNTSLEFIRPVQVFDFYLNFNVPKELNAYSAVTVWLTDIANPEIGLKFVYEKDAEGRSQFSLNDGTKYPVTADFFGGQGNFEATYDAAEKKVMPTSSISVQVETDFNGNAWNGFPSSQAYLRIELTGKTGTGKAGIVLNKLNNQPLSKIQSDIISPEVTMTSARGYKDVGEVFTIVPSFAMDVLDPDITFTMYVKDPNGEYVTAKDGTLLNEKADPTKSYEIVLESFGRYEVYYSAADSNGKEMIYSYMLTVSDIVAPEVELTDKVTEAKVGETVLIAETEITDNLSKEFTVVRYLELPNGSLVSLPGNSFIANMAGEYSVWYYVTDEAGNTAITGYTVTVTE